MAQENQVLLNIDLLVHFNNIKVKIFNSKQEQLTATMADIQAYVNALSNQLQDMLTNNYTIENGQDTSKEIVRREHIRYLSTLFPKSGFKQKFCYQESFFVSEQRPVGEFRNCYHRWEPGLAAFRKHVFSKIFINSEGNQQNYLKKYFINWILPLNSKIKRKKYSKNV